MLGLLFGASAQDKPKEDRWEPDIKAFEARDKEAPPPKNAALFVGSSSIRSWDLKKWFPGIDAINRGFGGSAIADSTRYAERIIFPHEPRVIVFYAGDNDVASGHTPEQVFDDYKAFVAKVRERLPKTPIVYIAIKPSIARWKFIDAIRASNKLIKEHADKEDLLEFVDIDTPMIGPDGKPRADLLLEDGLHLNDAGYKLWTELVMPFVKPAPV